MNNASEVGCAFLTQKTEKEFTKAIDVFQKILQENNTTEPGLMVLHQEPTLLNAIDRVFINSSKIACAWHIKKALKLYLAKALDSDSAKDFHDDFMKV